MIARGKQVWEIYRQAIPEGDDYLMLRECKFNRLELDLDDCDTAPHPHFSLSAIRFPKTMESAVLTDILGALDCYREHIYLFGHVLEAWAFGTLSGPEASQEILEIMGMRCLAGPNPFLG